MNPLAIALLRGEYTKLRSVAMKRVKRAFAAGLGWAPGIAGAYYRLPAIRQLSADDRNNPQVFERLIVEAKSFLEVEPTTLKKLRQHAAALLRELKKTLPIFAELMQEDGGRLFYQYYQQASAEAQEYIDYMEGKSTVQSKWDEEAMDFIREDFRQWRALNGYTHF